MEKNDSFQPTGKRLDNLNRKLKSDHPEDLWVMNGILDAFLSIIDSSSTIEQQRIVSKELNRLFDAYEFRYNTILENTIIMSEEFKRLQQLAGLPITENKVEETKETLNENFVGMGMVGNIFDREKTDYEIAFEHFTKGTSLNEVEDDMPEAPSHEETDAAQVYEANPLEGGPGYMTKNHAGVLARLISDLESEDTSNFSESNLKNYEEALSNLKTALEATKAKYKEETGKDL
jgi:hypothetical protein